MLYVETNNLKRRNKIALKLKVTDDKGISTEYHKIKNITASDCIKVNVESLQMNRTDKIKKMKNI